MAMCDACKLGGKSLAAGDDTRLVDALHEVCGYPDCTCQHKTVSALVKGHSGRKDG